MDLIEWHIKSTTKASQGLYEYDAVTRLRDSQLGDERVKDISNYIKKGKLWDAFTSDKQVVLLIDEIDKADIEFPNDLLQELDRMEFFCYETGETIPDELIEKLLKAGKFNQGFINTEYLAASLLDMDWHTLSLEDAKNISNNFENNSMNKIGLIDEIAPRYRSTYFAHIFSGGYSSGYYSYVHAAVLDSDAFEAFKEAGDVFDPELSASLRKNIYEKGSTEEAMDLYVNFRGRKPIIEPLLKVRGLDGSSD